MAADGMCAETASMSSKPATLFARLRAALHPFRVLPFLLPLPRMWVEMRCARRLDRLARRLQLMQGRIAGIQDHLLAGGTLPMAISDTDGALRRMLAGLRGELARMRCDLARWHAQECGGQSGTRLAEALARLNRIAVDTHATALKLEAELEARAQ
jgi:hypothetical protein